ncbi:kinase-like domain-containing protein [Fennellomyces sp. T-0311]|nr:kinase-like domain-containing protein [Fennellomyces sp. T-0311]
MHAAVHPLNTSDNYYHHHHHNQYPQAGQRRSSAPNRRTSMVLPTALLSRNRSTKSLRDRRRSSGAISTCSTMQKPRKLIGDYYLGKTLGKGASGRVKLGVHRHTGEQVAIKIISKTHLAANPAIEKAVRREIAIMKLIHHPNVMSLVDVIDDDNSPDLHLILEYVEGGELFEYLVSKGKLGENEARHHFQQMILGLDYCHHHLICHRDLKPENLLLDSSNNIKIADFGMASLQPAGSMLETSCGSPHYASPEIVAGMPYNGAASDIWSCGVILYALLTGHLPFDDDNIRQLLKKVKSGKYSMPETISRNAQDLIRRILVVDPAKRLTMEQIMAHPWFRETKPHNKNSLPTPPSPSEIGRPISDPSEIDDRILETIKFLWSESRDDAVIRALISNEPNMQKVVYVLLQQHAERYWQMEHGDDELSDSNDDETRYHNIVGTTRRRYRTVSDRPERDRRCMSMTDSRRQSHHRPQTPWMPEKSVNRRYSAVSMRVERQQAAAFAELPSPPPLPLSPPATPVQSAPIKKSQTFYERFVRGVLPSRRQSKDKTAEANTAPSSPPPTGGTLTGTLRRKNPFSKDNQKASKTPAPPPKSTLRHPGTLLRRNSKVDPSDDKNTKRLSIRVPNSNDTRKFGVFTLNGGSPNRRQRKQINMSVFEQHGKEELPPPQPPALSDGSTLSSSSSSSSSNHSNVEKGVPPTFKTALKTMPSPTLLSPPAVPPEARRRGSHASFQSFDRRGSDQSTTTRPTTPSLLSNSSTITTSPSGSYPSSPAVSAAPKTSWISNLFFFKQPKICTLTVYDTEIATVVRTLHRVINKVSDARLYEKTDKYGTRYKIEIKSKLQTGKSRQVKCRMDFLPSVDQAFTRVQFTQQQGDALFLASIVRQVQEQLEQETALPTMSKAAVAAAAVNTEEIPF